MATEEVTGSDLELRRAQLDEESLALRQVAATPSVQELVALREIAGAVAKTELVPVAYRNKPDSVLAVALTARELGIGLMYALRHVQIIEGKAGLSPELMIALIRRQGHKVRTIKADPKEAVIWAKRRDNGDEITVRFSIEDARRVTYYQRAEPEKGVEGGWKPLAEKLNYRNYPEDLCWSRAASRVSRRLFSDVLAGLGYVPHDLQAMGDSDEIGFEAVRDEVLTRDRSEATQAAEEAELGRRLDQAERDALVARAVQIYGGNGRANVIRLAGQVYRELGGWEPPPDNPDKEAPAGKLTVRHERRIRELLEEEARRRQQAAGSGQTGGDEENGGWGQP